MTEELYPEESQKQDVLGHLEELRRRLWICLAVLVTVSVALFVSGDSLMRFVKWPLHKVTADMRLIFISPSEAFSAYVKVALLAGFILSFPLILYQVWAFFAAALSRSVRRNVVLWLAMAFGLFTGGILFSYFVAIPAALSFLLNFGKQVAIPEITLGKYVSFFMTFLLIGGGIFEIPVAIGLLTDIGWLKSKVLSTKRPHALVVILCVAAIVTPTQDVFNMILFAFPMFILFEIGIVLSKMIEKRKCKKR